MVVLEPGRPRSFLRRRRYAVDLDGALRFRALNAELTRGRVDASGGSAPADFRRKLRRNSLVRLRLREPDPLCDLFVPLQGREIGPVQVLGNLPASGFSLTLERVLLADAHAADVLDPVGIDEAAPLDVADLLDIGGRRRSVDWPVVGRGNGSAGHDAAENAKRRGTTDPDAITGLRSWLGAAQGDGGQGRRGCSLQVSTHRSISTTCRRPRAHQLRGAASTGAIRCDRYQRPRSG